MTGSQKEIIQRTTPENDTSTGSSTSQGNKPRLFNEHLALNHAHFAKKVHDFGYIYSIYALLDAEILAYVSLKHVFDVFAGKNSADAMRVFLSSPTGILTASVESIGLISLSLLASSTDDKDPRPYRQAITALWPYFRNVISELKNTNKGVRNTLKIAALLHETNLNHLMMPVGILVSVTSGLNRIWFQSVQDERKALSNVFKTLNGFVKVKIKDHPTAADLVDYRQALDAYAGQISVGIDSKLKKLYLSAAYNGIMEALAYHIAPLALMAFTSPAFIPVASMCLVLSAAAITSRIFEEYEYQRGLQLETLAIKIQIKQRELELLKAQLSPDKAGVSEAIAAQYEELFPEILRLRDEFNAKAAGMVNYALRGVKSGLAAYAVVAKTLVISLMFFSTVPIALLVSSAAIGIALLVGFTLYSLSNYFKKQAQVKENSKLNEEATSEDSTYDQATQILTELLEAHTRGSKPGSSFYTGWFDIARAFFSGFNKGQKLIGYILAISFLESSLHSDLHDNPIVLITSPILGVFCSIVFSLRVYARNFSPNAETTKEYTKEGISDLSFSATAGEELSHKSGDETDFIIIDEEIEKRKVDKAPAKQHIVKEVIYVVNRPSENLEIEGTKKAKVTPKSEVTSTNDPSLRSKMKGLFFSDLHSRPLTIVQPSNNTVCLPLSMV
jgi:hypothetical protein